MNTDLQQDDPPISLIDRRTQREQVQEILERARAKNEMVRVRIPFTLYTYEEGGRGYIQVRDAVWNLKLPAAQTSTETIAKLIDTIGQCIVAIAREGSETVIAKLAGPLV